jgi:hypothetical protein
MSDKIENILDICLEELKAGTDIEALLMSYPDYALELRPLLELALEMNRLPRPKPSQEKISETLVKVGKEISKEKERPKWSLKEIFSWQPKLAWATSGAFALILTVLTMSSLSAHSMPGDLLYPIKLVTEKVKFVLTFNSESKAELRLTFSEERLDEMLKASQRSGTVDTTLLKSMLNQAQLALEQGEIPDERALPFLAKLQNVNIYQKKTLQNLRQSVDSSSRIVLDQAIETCCARERWLDQIIKEEAIQESDTAPLTSGTEQTGKKNWQWGPGCGCN